VVAAIGVLETVALLECIRVHVLKLKILVWNVVDDLAFLTKNAFMVNINLTLEALHPMYPVIELAPDGRLLVRRQKETPEGLHDTLTDITNQAHHWLDKSVILQAGTRLSGIFELLKANESLREVYTSNWAHAYLERYEAIQRGDITPDHRDDEANGPVIEVLEISLRQELRLPNQLLSNIVAAQDPNSPTATQYLNLVSDDEARRTIGDAKSFTVKDASRHWDVSGRSTPFTHNTEYSGIQYKAGSHINYSIGAIFDQCIDLPLRIGAGVVTLTISGQRRKDRLTVCVPLGSDEDPPSITLHELVGAITYEFSFYGGPEETEAELEKLRQTISEMDDAEHAEDMTFGMAHVFCPDGKLSGLQLRGRNLEDRARYWDRAMVMEHTGWTEAGLEARCRQGRLLELSALATSTIPGRHAYPAGQFIPGFDVELLRFLSWIASVSCSDWALHTFLSEWTTPGTSGVQINGWSVLALPDTPLEHQELADPIFQVGRNRRAPMRPVFLKGSAKQALIDAFEAFAAQRRQDYELRDELEEDD
jgi:hypothetical protein